MLARRSCTCMAVPPPYVNGTHPGAPRHRRPSPSAFPFVAWTVIGVMTIALAAAVIIASPMLATLTVTAVLLTAMAALLRARRWGALALVSTASVLVALFIESEVAIALMAIGLGGLLIVRLVAMHEGWIPRRILHPAPRVSTVPVRSNGAPFPREQWRDHF